MTFLTPDQVSSILESKGPGTMLYLVGAGGCGMSGLGHLFLDLGYRVAGSDLVVNAEVLQLLARGALIHTGHVGEHLRIARPVLVVCSSAIRADNPELRMAEELKIPVALRGIVLASLLRRHRAIGVAGMHGKTTTTAMLACALQQLGVRTSYAIGAPVTQLNPHAKFEIGTPSRRVSPQEPAIDPDKPHAAAAGQDSSHSGAASVQDGAEQEEFVFQSSAAEETRSFFVAEVDESDGTLRDFTLEHAIILNVDAEHLDYYQTLEAIACEFQAFASQVRDKIVYCADDPQLHNLFEKNPRAISYGFSTSAEYRVALKSEATTEISSGSSFELWRGTECLGQFSIRLMGLQNISNAAAVIALLHRLDFQPLAIAHAIRTFQGASRRQQELFRDERFWVIDDYGHHPNEIRPTLKAVRQRARGRVLAAFQPHRFTRTQHLMNEFASCFDDADQLWLTEIYPASEPPIAGVNGETLATAVRRQKRAVEYVPQVEDLRKQIRQALQPGDCVLFLGAGDITKAAHQLADDLNREAAERKASLRAELSGRLSAAAILRCDELLAKRTTLRVGGRADYYVEPASEADLAEVLKFCTREQLPVMILGRGSNLLIRDGGIRGVVICLAQPTFSEIEVRGEELHCRAGARLRAVAMEAKRNGLGGLEFLEGIPGSIGGALRMNAGAMGDSMFNVVQSVRFMDFTGTVHEKQGAELKAEYRSCALLKAHVALSAVLKGEPAPRELIAEKMNACSQKRWTSQPAAPSAGCIFKNPSTIPAGKLIDELGLKGTRVGGAVISPVHGNFIVNEGNAKAQDVLNLIDIVKQTARSIRGIELETEVEIVGETGIPE